MSNSPSSSSGLKQLSPIDQFVMGFDSILRGLSHKLAGTGRVYPAKDVQSSTLTAAEQQHSAGLMRINYTGEVAAQALYLGQALVARNYQTRATLLQAAYEEQDHLLWCQQRLNELHSRTSYLNPVWFIGSLSIGIMAGLVSDKYSLGFVVETERQVEAHLQDHLNQLPHQDHASQLVLQQMCLDEHTHAANAMQQGAAELPAPIKFIMKFPAKIMTSLTYYI